MIRTDLEYRESKRRLEQGQLLVQQQREALEERALTEEEIQRVLDPLQAFQQQIADEVRWYEKVRSGVIPPLRSLSQMGRLLTATRIAKGISQRELAERLGVSESSVSRDERGEYHGITIERAQRILDALNAKFEVTVNAAAEGDRERMLAGSVT